MEKLHDLLVDDLLAPVFIEGFDIILELIEKFGLIVFNLLFTHDRRLGTDLLNAGKYLGDARRKDFTLF